MSKRQVICRVGKTFYQDHIYRDLPEEGRSDIVGVVGATLLVRMDRPAFNDLLSDAEYYSGLSGDFDNRSLIKSASRLAIALRQQEPTWASDYDAQHERHAQ